MLPRVNRIYCNEADYLLFATKDVISNVLYNTGQWEQYLIEISKQFIKDIDNSIVIDVGANLGAYSIPIAKSILDFGGKVIGFEPQRIVYYQLCGNVILNRLDNYYAYNQAVGDFNDEIEMPEINYEENHNIGAFSLDSELRLKLNMDQYILKNNFKIPIITLNKLELSHAPSLIKIDVEGYELKVLKGAEEFLEKHNYPPLLFEAWDFSSFEEERNNLLKFIKYLGYEISLNFNQEYIAQHSKNARYINFLKTPDGTINMVRER